MNRAMLVVVGCGLAATWLGCQPVADSTVPVSSTAVSDSATPGATLVSLAVPNML